MLPKLRSSITAQEIPLTFEHALSEVPKAATKKLLLLLLLSLLFCCSNDDTLDDLNDLSSKEATIWTFLADLLERTGLPLV